MNVCVCKECKKMFNSDTKREYCAECMKIHKDPFDDVVEYLKEFPNSNAMQISEALDIPIHVIINYIDEKRLHMVKGSFEKVMDNF